jgi:hypothetical protein
MAGSELEISALYGLPLAQFTGARNELAKQARAQGDLKLADQIKSLQKPTLPAWALNMLPRLRQGELRELLRAGEQAEAAQAGALAGRGVVGQLQEASETLRRAARSLAGEAGEILVKGGHAAREENLLRIARALETCAVTAEGRRQLQEGEFATEPEAAGFDLFAQMSTAPAGKRSRTAAQKPSSGPPQPPARQEQAEERRAAQRAVEEARADLKQRRGERAGAEAASRDAERVARTKQREAEQAWELVERVRRRVEQAQAAELEARQRLDDAKERLRARK